MYDYPFTENSTGKLFVILESRIDELFKKPEEYEIMKEQFKGSDLVGKKYAPLFPYFLHLKSSAPDTGAFRVVRWALINITCM